MNKKNFTAPFDTLLGEKPKFNKKMEEKKKVVTSIITTEEILEKIRGIAYWDRKNIKDVLNLALKEYIKSYEATKGPIKAVPSKNIEDESETR
jgi:hypothetical protein